ncbi:class I SAM-dependent methyltransferase [Sphingomonas sp. SUN019]|uniref:class I SAM-dependent methyltransferase n=1 Tax=Sphingomonas sp. SUN019 TaxID=2937788 RepID=UPI002164D3E6|nr:class I SAM-dependent methyltransferase [Sphingomonas sp. SUN019]UVO51814.1 class I SAM-dependent methyltransferase [Sphingomonas sp. SUN019]
MSRWKKSPSPKFEPAIAENFDLDRYLAANPDVAQHVMSGGDGAAHFREFGLAERRRQMTAASFSSMKSRIHRRYERFAPVLDASKGARGNFRFAAEKDAFPILYGASTYDLAAYDAESANAGFGPFVTEVEQNPDKLYADIGCGRRHTKSDNCLYIEVYPSVSADLIMEPGSRYPIASESLDGIGCFAVLEHVEEPWKVAEEFRRMLKPGGKVFIDWPFLQPVHGYPSHYYNATRAGLRRMFDDGYDIELIDTLANQTPAHSITWYLSAMLSDLAQRDPAAHTRLLATPAGQLVAESPTGEFWTGLVASLSPEMVMTLACGNSLIARKK